MDVRARASDEWRSRQDSSGSAHGNGSSGHSCRNEVRRSHQGLGPRCSRSSQGNEVTSAKAIPVVLLHAADEAAEARNLAESIREFGYEVWHTGEVLVGNVVVKE